MTSVVDPENYQIAVHLLDTVTGERAVHNAEGWDEEGEFADFIWRDGNWSCDCNRAVFFGHPDCECGDDRYVVEKIVRVSDGVTVYADDHEVRSSVPPRSPE